MTFMSLFLLLKAPHNFWTKILKIRSQCECIAKQIDGWRSRKKKNDQLKTGRRRYALPRFHVKKPRRFHVKNDRPSIGSAFSLKYSAVFCRLAPSLSECVCPHASVLNRQNHFGCLNSQHYWIRFSFSFRLSISRFDYQISQTFCKKKVSSNLRLYSRFF